MSGSIMPASSGLNSPAVTGGWLSLGLAVWFTIVLLLGASGAYVTAGGAPPLALLVTLAAPIIGFLAAYRASDSFRALVLGADLRLLTGIQGWRIGGFSFLALYSYGILPGYFAWPAGLGDMAIGVTAPWLIVALMRRPGFIASRAFAFWQVFGILDLVVAVALGTLGPRLFAAEAAGAEATAAMAQLPLALIPAFFVPAFIIMHLAALFQARRFDREREGAEES